MRYCSGYLMNLIEHVTNSEFDQLLWRDDPNLDIAAREARDIELFLDLTGNLDSEML